MSLRNILQPIVPLKDISKSAGSIFRWLCIALLLTAASPARPAEEPLFVAPLYVEYASVSPDEFAKEANELKQRLGKGPNVLVGFSTFLNMRFARPDLGKPIDPSAMQPTLQELDLIIDRARSNDLPIHVAVVSGFFHGNNTLRDVAIREDVRNAQWFSDGWIAPPEDLNRGQVVPSSAWITPSRYAQPLRQRIEEGVRILGQHLAATMETFPGALQSISGDAEVELSFERNFEKGAERRGNRPLVYTDYSPFMIAEFRDWLRGARYEQDLSPDTDENGDGHTFNKDFHQQFRTWRLRYFDESGPIRLDKYVAMPEKLPQSGPFFVKDGFDAPRVAEPADLFWKTWKEFRIRVIANYLRDFGRWLTADSRIPASRFYTHQIPADFLFGGKDGTRIETSASPLDAAVIQPLGSAGVTVFNVYNGKTHSKTSSRELFQRLAQSGAHWGIMEYNPSVPAVADENYYLEELRTLSAFRPSVILPFAWTNTEQHRLYAIKGSAYEHALRRFIEDEASVRR